MYLLIETLQMFNDFVYVCFHLHQKGTTKLYRETDAGDNAGGSFAR